MKEVKTYAEVLLQRGVPYDEILKEPSLKGVTRAQLRMWKSRLNKGENKTAKIATPKADATPLATIATELQRGEATQETETQPLENAQGTPVLVDFAKTTVQNFHPADLIYFGSILIACNGIANALHGVGVYVATFYFAVAFVALQGVKTTSGAWRVLHVAVLLLIEVLVGGVAHIIWANEALWANVTALPLDIWPNKYRNDLGEVVMLYGGSDIEMPFKIACGAAAFFVSSGFYACLIALKKR